MIDDSAYVDNKIFLEKYQQRYNEIVEAMDEIRVKEDEEKKSKLQEQARVIVTGKQIGRASCRERVSSPV